MTSDEAVCQRGCRLLCLQPSCRNLLDPSHALRRAGLRSTPARVAVLECVESLGRPATHAELQGLLELDKVTLYRTLDALAEAELVHRVLGVDGVWRHCAQPKTEGCPGNHAHFQCTACGAVICLLDQPIPHVQVPEGAVVQARTLLAWGLCPDCAEGR